jgi:hypothetical protein
MRLVVDERYGGVLLPLKFFERGSIHAAWRAGTGLRCWGPVREVLNSLHTSKSHQGPNMAHLARLTIGAIEVLCRVGLHPELVFEVMDQ